jgi:acyl carrier protein
LQPLPAGVPGELYIGGVGLAVGYLNRPALTAERFVPSGYSSVPGERLYRTGDLARWLPNGSLEYLGRVDHQVKIRGFRIELGEIESVLLAHEAVREAVVVARDYSGDKRLVGYVVAKSGIQIDDAALVQELRGRLQEQLPSYMVPSSLMALPNLPLTGSGKVDRKALPVPEDNDLLKARYVAPRNATEERMCALWQEVLKVERVGIEDNFFTLGGHSLLAVRLVNLIHQEFGTELSLLALFESPTVAALSERLSAAPTSLTQADGVKWETGLL